MPRGPTSRHVAATVGGQVAVHTFRCIDSVLVWDPEARQLREQPTTGTAPSSRGLHVRSSSLKRPLPPRLARARRLRLAPLTSLLLLLLLTQVAAAADERTLIVFGGAAKEVRHN